MVLDERVSYTVDKDYPSIVVIAESLVTQTISLGTNRNTQR